MTHSACDRLDQLSPIYLSLTPSLLRSIVLWQNSEFELLLYCQLPSRSTVCENRKYLYMNMNLRLSGKDSSPFIRSVFRPLYLVVLGDSFTISDNHIEYIEI